MFDKLDSTILHPSKWKSDSLLTVATRYFVIHPVSIYLERIVSVPPSPHSHFSDFPPFRNGGKRYPIISRHKSILRPPLRSDCVFFLSDVCQDNSAHFPLISFPSYSLMMAIPTNKDNIVISERSNVWYLIIFSFEQQNYLLRWSDKKICINNIVSLSRYNTVVKICVINYIKFRITAELLKVIIAIYFITC